jgi:hypothetical protein
MNPTEYYEYHKSKAGRSYEMFSKAGNKKCHSIAGAAIRKIAGKKRVTEQQILDLVSTKIMEVYKAGKHKEILDSEPPYHIAFYINQALKVAGYSFEIDHYDFDFSS